MREEHFMMTDGRLEMSRSRSLATVDRRRHHFRFVK